MEKNTIYAKLADLKVRYENAQKQYKEYLKCVEQYELLLSRMDEHVCRLLVDKNYRIASEGAYFNESESFSFKVDPADFSIDLCEMINEMLKEYEIGSLVIEPRTDNASAIILKINFNGNKKVSEIEQAIRNLKENKETMTMSR